MPPNGSPPQPPLPPFDVNSVDWRTRRYEVYETYRTRDPVHLGTSWGSASADSWYLFRWEEVSGVLADARFGREEPGADPSARDARTRLSPGLFELDQDWLIHRDPPAHTELRAWVARAFATDFVERAAGRTAELIDALVAEAPTHHPFDVVTRIAEPLPARLVAEFIGFEEGEAMALEGPLVTMLRAETPRASRERARVEVAGALRGLVEARRAGPREDVVGRLVSARPDTPTAHIVSTCLFLLTSGWGGMVTLLGSGVLLLLGPSGRFTELASDDGLARGAVEECLRIESPVQIVDRWVHEGVRIADRLLRRGDRVYLVLGAANRDPERFAQPDAFDPAREGPRSLALGGGAHACLGAHLAGTVARAAFRQLSLRLPRLRLAGAPLWRSEPDTRALASLDVVDG